MQGSNLSVAAKSPLHELKPNSRKTLFSSSDIPRVPYTGGSGHIRKHLPTSRDRSERPSQSGLFPNRIHLPAASSVLSIASELAMLQQ